MSCATSIVDNVSITPSCTVGGSEWTYLEDNTKHLIFWLCNMKQLHFRHFNTTSKKFTVTVNFFQKETKTALNRPILSRSFRLFCDNSRLFQKISEDYRRPPKTTKEVRRLPKISKNNRRFPRRNPKIFQKQIRFDNGKRLWFFFFTKNPPNT